MLQVKSKPVSFGEGIKKIATSKVIMAVGNEPFYRDKVKNRVIGTYKDYEIVRLDAKEKSEAEILGSVGFKDLFNTKRIFIISNFTKIKKLDYFINKNFSDILILDSDKKGKSKLYKDLEKNCLCIECIKPKPWDQERDARAKIKGYLTNAGYNISDEIATYLFSQIGYNLYKLMKEMQKIEMYKENDDIKNITKEDIDAVCVTGLNYNIFDLIEKIIDGKKKEALELMHKIFKYENSPAILLINIWYTHFENLLYLKTTSNQGTEIYDYIKLPPTVVKSKLIPQTKKITDVQIIDSLNYLSEIDYSLRKGSFDLKFYLENFIIKF